MRDGKAHMKQCADFNAIVFYSKLCVCCEIFLQNLLQKEASHREQRLNEMMHNFQVTDAELQTCLASIVHEAEQLQQLDQQLLAVDTSAGTVTVLFLLCFLHILYLQELTYICFNE